MLKAISSVWLALIPTSLTFAQAALAAYAAPAGVPNRDESRLGAPAPATQPTSKPGGQSGGQQAGQPGGQPARVVDYKRIGEVTLRMHIIGAAEGKNRTAVVLFFCGAWTGFDAGQYFPQSAYFASRGAICFNAEVRSMGVHKTTPVECVIDAKSAVRWVRQHAEDYGVNPDHIVAFGASAGGHVSACAAFADDFNDPGDDKVEKVSARPDALLLACPVVVAHEGPRWPKLFGGEERARALSPVLLVKAKGPPTLIMQGDADTTTPAAGAAKFADAMRAAGNRCDLKIYPKAGHGFQNWFDGCNVLFTETLRDMDKFLSSLGMLSGPPTVDSFRYEPIADPALRPAVRRPASQATEKGG